MQKEKEECASSWTKEIGELNTKLTDKIESGDPNAGDEAKAIKTIRQIQRLHQQIKEAKAGKATEVKEKGDEIKDLDDKITKIILNPDQMELFPFGDDETDPMEAVRDAAANMGVAE